MSDSFITQCPHCQTRFRVNSAQLGAASGAVRCGTCLKVFNAPQNMLGESTPAPILTAVVPPPVSPPSPTPAPAPKPAIEPAAPATAEAAPVPAPAFTAFAPEKSQPVPAPVSGAATLGWPLAPHAARHSSDVAEKIVAPKPMPEATPAPVPEPRPEPRPEPAPAVAAAPAAPVMAAAPVTDESASPETASAKKDETLWIHDDLDLDNLNLDEELAKLDEFELSQEFLSIDRAPGPSEALQVKQDEKRDPHDERWAEALLQAEQPSSHRAARQEPSLDHRSADEPEEPASSPLPPPDEAPASAQEPEAAAPATSRIDTTDDDDGLPTFSARRDDDEPEHVEEDHDDEPTVAAPRTDSHRADPALRNDGLQDLSDEPLQLDWQKPKRRWGRRLFWLLLVLLALAALAGQYIAYHFEELARQDQFRPWFAQACPELGCTLPSKVDVEQIRSSNLVVRSHPDFSGALVVDAIIYNRANFSQPFPLLEMRFADLNGQLIASRRFKPSEYLSGELAGQNEMPPQTPIHISLDILDPGPKAVNYSLSFHSPE
ncbi:DUF3426 domain-containing protein [Pseudomonas sp. ATCC 13867]|uniref:DUF3426 domain-containing protein n=1 Tax=Pseudomonas sp. ATCC 13867 TaxID=1294143 RepID=UPI0005A226FE|nr:DUF3426 domain-containing protein [Pseudomonas sp. ATCC 13867]